nr:MAG TPA: hypothetical protein [Caudoviricetes sp.]
MYIVIYTRYVRRRLLSRTPASKSSVVTGYKNIFVKHGKHTSAHDMKKMVLQEMQDHLFVHTD